VDRQLHQRRQRHTRNDAAQDQFLFWDSLHPTETGHQAIADLAEEQLSGTPVLAVEDTTTDQPVTASGTPYTGPVSGLEQQYINITTDSLNITATTPNWFVHSGGGEDAIAVASGTNVLDGGTGSNFLTGGSGTDTFFVDDRGPTADIWSTVNGFHAGDAATIWGVAPQDFTLSWVDG
jgi:Ca2+-binding RTX toxin-like protein